MRRFFYALAGGLVMLAVTTPARSAPKVEADPDVEYAVTPQAGVWMVLAGSYRGPDAHNLARQLVYQLRKRDHLPAYLFDFSEAKRREQREYLEELHRRSPDSPARTIHVEDEYGVLVGGYKTVDDARDVMLTIRKLPLPELKLPGGKSPYDLIEATDPETGKPAIDKKTGKEIGKVPMSPFMHCFVTRNPTVPVEKPDPNKADPLLKELNKDEEYSLFKAKHPWTLVVKQYEGVSVLQPSSPTKDFLKVFSIGDRDGEKLNAAALNAHNLAEALRKKDLDAYVLHTRRCSLVTIGAFDSPDDPQLLKMQKALCLKMGQPTDGKAVDPQQLQFFAKPVPMKVPQVEK
jgi:hypothetical protein